MKKKLPSPFMTGLLAAMMPDGPMPIILKKEKALKNKYNLTPAELESMKSMTPKEKKQFLKTKRRP